MMIRLDKKLPNSVLDRIRAVAVADPATAKTFSSWINPPPKSAASMKTEKKLKHMQQRNAVQRAAQDKSWIEFAAKLRADPASMRKLHPTTAKEADARLYHLWELLVHVAGADRRYAIGSVAALEPMIGAEATEGLRLGLIAHWHAWSPWLRSMRPDEALGQIRSFDSMGIAGVTLEARATPGWAHGLTNEDAARAVGYATLELNGFPNWLPDLVRAKPKVVCDVLSREVEAELERSLDGPRFGILEDLAQADLVVSELMAPMVLEEIERRPALATAFLRPALDIILRGLPPERQRLKELALGRFSGSVDSGIASSYNGPALRQVPAGPRRSLRHPTSRS
jgi:hypothetical protein